MSTPDEASPVVSVLKSTVTADDVQGRSFPHGQPSDGAGASQSRHPRGQDQPSCQLQTLPQDHLDAQHEEHQYLSLVRDLLDGGEHRQDRTGTGTLSVFAPRPLKFRLSAGNDAPDRGQGQHRLILPLLTTKRVYTRAVIAELLWFISGATSSKSLSAQGVRIWDDNGSRGFLDSVGLSHRDEGDLGPVYGFQWRHFGAEYVDAETDYTGRGVDQLAEVIDKLRNRPYDRRILLSAWNPADLKKMALPPCHLLAQFYVSFPGAARGRDAAAAAAAAAAASPTDARGKGVLHCQLYQRSCDIGLGVPFNIASYALLTHMLAHVTDLVPGTFTMVMGDAHVYLDHLSALEEQIGREPRPFPELIIKRARPAHTDEQPGHGTPNAATDIDGWTSDDFEIRGYEPHKAISMKMSV